MDETPNLTPPQQDPPTEPPREPPPPPSGPPSGPELARNRILILIGVSVIAVGVVGLYLRARANTNHVALASGPRPVSVEKAQAGSFRAVRSYVGTTDAWNAAPVGPQYVSAYIGTVLVRPGAPVKRGDVLATLDCRNASASSRELASRAKALAERQVAAEHEAARVHEMAEQNFASKNEAEQLNARATAAAAEVESLRAALQSRTLEVDDCVLRAPFTGEVAERYADPGSYARPGKPIVSVIDRSIVRVTADAPEGDFAVVAPGTPVAIEVVATGAKLSAKISRRAPAADESTRTVHFEIDLPNADRALPTGTTAQLTIEVGTPQPATLIPLRAATQRGPKATLFTVDGGVAHRRVLPVVGERGGTLYVDPALAAGSLVVTEGRALLDDGDPVAAQEHP